MPSDTLYARQTLILRGEEYHPGDELPPQPSADDDDGIDARGKRYIRDQFGRHWRILHTGTVGHETAELDPHYDPGEGGRVFDPEYEHGLIARGLATTDPKEAALLRKIREVERQRNPETADVVDAQVAKLRAKLSG